MLFPKNVRVTRVAREVTSPNAGTRSLPAWSGRSLAVTGLTSGMLRPCRLGPGTSAPDHGRVPAADALPAGVRLGVTVLGQILGPAAVTGQQQREPDHPGLGRRDKAGELITLRLPHHRTRLPQSSIALHVPRRSDAALGSARPGIQDKRRRAPRPPAGA